MDWNDPNLRWVLLGTMLLGIASGTLGAFAFLRGRSLMGDALAHAALPGVCVAFMMGQWLQSRGVLGDGSAKSLALILLGAGASGLIAAWCIAGVARHSRLKEDTTQAIVLSVFFGLGVVLLTHIQHSGAGGQSGLDKFLFGQAASLIASDVRLMAGIALILCALSFTLFKEWKLLCFDPAFGTGLGLPMARLDGLLLLMIVAAVVIGLQAVGVVLIAALLITPPAAARFWTDRLSTMILLSAFLGGCSGVLGTILSALPSSQGLPTGPMIVMAATFVFVISVLFAPRRGAVARVWRVWRTREKVLRENLLRDWYEVLENHQVQGLQTTVVSLDELSRKRSHNAGGTLKQLEKMGLARHREHGWELTEAGQAEAHRVTRNHRLWEMFLMYETSLGAVAVDRDADTVEHFLPPEAIEQLEIMLRQIGHEPRLQGRAGAV
jgi:manganese/zinc/iron transport system permease protein